MKDPGESGAESSELDELQEEATLDEEVSEEPAGRRRIFTEKSDPPVSALHDRYHAGDMILDPHFQRREVWDNARASRRKRQEGQVLQSHIVRKTRETNNRGRESLCALTDEIDRAHGQFKKADVLFTRRMARLVSIVRALGAFLAYSDQRIQPFDSVPAAEPLEISSSPCAERRIKGRTMPLVACRRYQ